MTGRPRGALLFAGTLVLSACGSAAEPSSDPSGSASATESTPTEPTPSPLIDTDEIVQVFAPDSIPAIDDPSFVDPDEADFLVPLEPVLAIEIEGDARAYPLQILTWHEIVNDVVGGVPVAITYCPLCNTGIAFVRPVIEGGLLDFGTSGSLYRSNLLMYDRQTETLWSQVIGRAVDGPLAGTDLELAPVQLVSFEDWKAAHPDGLVLSADTGYNRPYGSNPYIGYDAPGTRPFLYDGPLDARLPPKVHVIGVLVGEHAVAYPFGELRERAVGDWAAVADRVGGLDVVVVWKDGTLSALDTERIARSRQIGAAGVFIPLLEGRELSFRATPLGIVDEQTGSTWDVLGRAVDGPLVGARLVSVIAVESLWFDWAAFFPQTRIFDR